MRKLIIIITIIMVANVIGFGPTICNAQIDGAAPLPEIKKSSGPSLEETKQWITQKFASLSQVTLSKDYKYHNHYLSAYDVSFEDCAVIATTIHPNEGNSVDIKIYDFNFRDIDEDTMMTGIGYDGEPYFTFHYTPGIKRAYSTVNNVARDEMQEVIKIVLKEKNQQTKVNFQFALNGHVHWANVNPSAGFSYYFPDIESAESMLNASKHAAMLCRQKAAAEKNAKPAKQKDLF